MKTEYWFTEDRLRHEKYNIKKGLVFHLSSF